MEERAVAERAPSLAIVGAGIGGLTLAAFLGRAGLRYLMLEQAPALRAAGAGIQLSPNAVRLLHRLGLEPGLDAVAVRPAALEMCRWDDGKAILRTPLGEACEERFGAPYRTVHRADLQRLLLENVPAEHVRLGWRCVRLEERRDGVLLHGANGRTAGADLVVGADGIHSAVRASLATDRTRFSGHAIFRGVVPAERVADVLTEPVVRLWLGPGQHAVSYPVARGRLVSFGASVPCAADGEESWSAPGRPEDMMAAYAGWNAGLRRLLGAAPEVGRWLLHDRDSLERWSTARVTLLGDAAHPMLPFRAQGASMAIEDAAVLATCLRQSGEREPAGALHRYECIRKARTGRLHELSRANSDVLHLPDGPEQEQRDRRMRKDAGLDRQAWLYGHDAEAAVGA